MSGVLRKDITDGIIKGGVPTKAESATVSGHRFNVESDFVLGSGATKYILYQMPPESSGHVVGLQNRIFKSLNGEAELTILWNSTSFTTIGSPYQYFNENRNSQLESTVTAQDVTIAEVNEGDVRETDFLNGSGSGSNSSGDVSAGSGLRIYSPDSFYIAKVTNLHSQSNRIILAYSHIEINLEDVGL